MSVCVIFLGKIRFCISESDLFFIYGGSGFGLSEVSIRHSPPNLFFLGSLSFDLEIRVSRFSIRELYLPSFRTCLGDGCQENILVACCVWLELKNMEIIPNLCESILLKLDSMRMELITSQLDDD